MKAMILAAGRGERMRPLTDVLPKPMLTVSGMPLIEYHIRKLAKVGIKDIVINLAWLGEKIENYLGDGKEFNVNISYSWEREGALETAGGIINALPYLTHNDEPFLVVNGDVFVDYDFSSMPHLPPEYQAHFWLVFNPEHNEKGDFSLDVQQVLNIVEDEKKPTYTYSGIGLFRPSFFQNKFNNKIAKLAPLMRSAVSENKVSGEILSGLWTDVGTPERLRQLQDK